MSDQAPLPCTAATDMHKLPRPLLLVRKRQQAAHWRTKSYLQPILVLWSDQLLCKQCQVGARASKAWTAVMAVGGRSFPLSAYVASSNLCKQLI
jgi:hypothetical protein